MAWISKTLVYKVKTFQNLFKVLLFQSELVSKVLEQVPRVYSQPTDLMSSDPIHPWLPVFDEERNLEHVENTQDI